MNILTLLNYVFKFIIEVFATKLMLAITVVAYVVLLIFTFLCFLPSYYLILISLLFAGVIAPWTFGIVATIISKCARKLDSYNIVQDAEQDGSSQILDTKSSRSAYHLFTFTYTFFYLAMFMTYYFKQESKLCS
jgi:hypothetical protein